MTKFKLIFSIYGLDFKPLDFSKDINIEPTKYWLIGDSVKGRTNIIRKETAWEFEIDFLETLYLNDILDKFLDKFASKSDIISSFIKNNNLESKIEVVLEIYNYQTPSIFLNKELILFLSKINGEFDLDMYFMNNEENNS